VFQLYWLIIELQPTNLLSVIEGKKFNLPRDGDTVGTVVFFSHSGSIELAAYTLEIRS